MPNRKRGKNASSILNCQSNLPSHRLKKMLPNVRLLSASILRPLWTSLSKRPLALRTSNVRSRTMKSFGKKSRINSTSKGSLERREHVCDETRASCHCSKWLRIEKLTPGACPNALSVSQTQWFYRPVKITLLRRRLMSIVTITSPNKILLLKWLTFKLNISCFIYLDVN